MTEQEIRSALAQAAGDVREKNPQAPSVTNTVTQDFVANAQLAVGGSATMIYLPDECEQIAATAPAFYINTGTMLPVLAETLPRTAKTLHDNRTPWVLDPVGIGMNGLRTKILSGFKDCKPSIVRGNASEIIALAKLWQLVDDDYAGTIRGVDSTEKVSAAKTAAIALAKFTGGAVAVSGEEDLITDGEQTIICAGGSAMLTKVTGSGCALGGVMAVYAAVANPFTAALTATTAFNLAGMQAAAKSDGPASFKIKFLDALYKLTAQEIADSFRAVGVLDSMLTYTFGMERVKE
ncbi:MAG: hydroxyethylthiazole kinase [Quinella sp. 2Q5]|nr:hydroxyethylthiazole kinase [Quinella sp. 2Q5]